MRGEAMTSAAPTSSFINSVHAVEMGKEAALLTPCGNPLCEIQFPQTGLKIEPRRFCSPDCRQQASLIRRVVALLEGHADRRVIELDGYVLTRAKAMLDEVGTVEFNMLLQQVTL